MGIFGNLFISPKEKKIKELNKNKPQYLMHTSTVFPDRISIIRPTFNKETNTSTVFSTDSEKLATAYAMQPFFSFRFGENEIALIVLGNQHDLLKLDSKTAYIYYVDSNNFNPVVDNDANFYNEWASTTEIQIRKDIPPKKILFNDVLRSGIQVFWINNMDTLLEIDKEMQNNNIVTGEEKIEFLINQTNWRPDKIIYLNRFRNICPVFKNEKGYIVDYNKMNNIPHINQKKYIEFFDKNI